MSPEPSSTQVARLERELAEAEREWDQYSRALIEHDFDQATFSIHYRVVAEDPDEESLDTRGS